MDRCAYPPRFSRRRCSPRGNFSTVLGGDTQQYCPLNTDGTSNGYGLKPERRALTPFCHCNRGTGGRQNFVAAISPTSAQVRNNTPGSIPTTGLADLSFGSGTLATSLRHFTIQADGKILAGGAFMSIGGQVPSDRPEFDPTTGLIDSSAPIPTPTLHVTQSQCRRDGRYWWAAGFLYLLLLAYQMRASNCPA